MLRVQGTHPLRDVRPLGLALMALWFRIKSFRFRVRPELREEIGH